MLSLSLHDLSPVVRTLPQTVVAQLSPSSETQGPASRYVARWLFLALGSLLLAGLLSLAVVIGRLPPLSRLIDDPLFFKRCLVVHVDLALVVWFYAFISALAALRVRCHAGWHEGVAFISAVLGVVFLVLGGALTGAAPVLANYIPVVDHPVFLLGLGLFFFGVIAHTLRTLGESTFQRTGGLSPDAGVGVQASGLALVLAASSWVSAQAGLPEGLDRRTHFEFAHWGAGHVLQVANVAAMLAIWLWLAARATGRPVLTARRARWLFGCLLLPHAVMPLLSWQGALHRTYVEGATLLMRWGIFPVVLATLVLCLRHRRQRPDRIATEHTRLLWTGLATSAGLTLLGFLLGACIRGSTTLVPAHYHASLGGITAAFMVAAHLLKDQLSPASSSALQSGGGHARSARRQLICFGAGQAVFALGFGWAGLHGLGRKVYAGEQHVRTFSEHVGLGIMGLGGLVAAAGGVWFLVLLLRRRPSLSPQPSPVSS